LSETCDVLVVGGGSAGCVLARRLADRTRGRIILVEAGKSDEGDPAAIDLFRLDEQTEDYDWGFKAATLAGRPPELSYSRARILGGCANHNDCAFLEPPGSDFDEWVRLGAAGWTPDAMARCFERIRQTIKIEPAPQHELSRAFVEAAKAAGLPEVDFRDGARQGAGWFPLNAKSRLRQSSSVAYLHPLSALPPHVEVWTETTAQRLVFDGRRVSGLETSRGRIDARRAVILACGAIQTPQLLMVSGMGPAGHLRKFGIELVADAPGVGQNLRDHVAAPVVWSTREPIAPWSVCPFEATLMMKLDADAPAPDVLFHFGLRVREKYGDDRRLPVSGPAVKASPNVTRARSRGSVSLSGPAMSDPPVIELNYLSDPYDLRILIEAMQFARKLGKTDPFARHLSAEVHPGPGVETHEDWAAYVRRVCETVYHPCGTAAIGRVLTPDLAVIGSENLYVADASVFPSMITVNINSAVMMVAERAAEIIPV
jgi:choline dehydrogenase-like flavoprotein